MMRTGWSGIALAATVVAFAVMPACTLIEPEVGDRIPACSDADSDPSTNVDFAKQIRPLFDDKVPGTRGCKDCHYPGEGTEVGIQQVQLAMKPLSRVRVGGVNSRDVTIVPKSPCKSVIVQKLRGTFGGARMPKTGPFWGPKEMQLLQDWIAEGAIGDGNL
ncbi:MAG: hypothetical protein JST00_30520 [Deltaproteobacteria bacterium]|nr:hypothetical protein [Deltaproteobacteria bacterium]